MVPAMPMVSVGRRKYPKREPGYRVHKSKEEVCTIQGPEKTEAKLARDTDFSATFLRFTMGFASGGLL